MEVNFENQRCQIPFVLVKMTEIPGVNSVEHDGMSHIKLHSSSPIDCIGDAQVLAQIFKPSALDIEGLDIVNMKKHMPI
jgi:hypothetical protein